MRTFTPMLTSTSALLAVLLPLSAQAKPEGPALFCEQYPDAPARSTGAVSCVTCHELSGAPNLNPYGEDVKSGISEDYEAELKAALVAIEDLDSDGDGALNGEEIAIGTWPGFSEEVEPECLPQLSEGNDWYAVGSYDPVLAFERITVDFCGRSPRYDELQGHVESLWELGWSRGDGNDFDARDEAAIVGLLHEQLDACLQSPYWDEVLWEIGVGVVRPKGLNSDAYILGNYEWDLRLFAYAVSEDRDAADLFEATYLVVEEPQGSGILVAIDDPRSSAEEYAQPLAAEDRFGLVTTRFSLAMNVMFAPVPRTLAAHYYRELLGQDISMTEGLYPVDELDGELDWDAPRDVDEKGVWQEGCAACHTTLDPLSYPWARYNGIDLENGTTATLLEDRAVDVLPTTDGYIFGVPVSSPEEWVAEAVASDHFSERITELFWTYLLRRTPYSCEDEEFQDLWTGFRDGVYPRTGTARERVVEDMLHELVLTDAYATP